MSRRRTLLLATTLAAIAAVALVALVSSGPGRELGGELGIRADRPFAARLSGPLYAARTLRDRDDGAPDVAFLTCDAALTATVRAEDAAGVRRVLVRVDGRTQVRRDVGCPSGRCPRRVVVTATPGLVAAGSGTHRVEVLALAPGATAPSRVARITVGVGDARAATGDIEPRPRTAPVLSLERPRPAVDRLVRTVASRAPLARLLGRSRLRLRERGTGSGVVTVLADVVPARTGVAATLPQPGDEGPATLRARVLRDLLLDVDLRTGRLIAAQPGPGSVLSRWSPATEPPAGESADEAPSSAFTARRPPRLQALSERGPRLFVEDGDPDLRSSGRDWPVSMIFTGHASVASVKAGLRRIGLVRRGSSRSLGYRLPGSDLLRFDADRGLKDPCDAAGTDLHARVYAPTATDRFTDPELGGVVVATVHLDHRDGCGVGPQQFGFSERAEARLAGLIASRLRWRVRRDALDLGNGEPLRRDAADPGHLWLADGAATLVTVP
ncbi:hypothetical protein [Patulibacter minatonensis]|uniref:hypothetical protein n=1 Tax=Patulibacter minatonensis TaxID=298163 RepID=UPI00047DAB60|nr:hypothetical protein [Patulibacter minatonensis]